MTEARRPRVGLFATCLVDLFRPAVGFAAVRLLEDAGCEVVVPLAQTCCGQPAYNSGQMPDARRLALQTIEAFERCDYVVAPSGSCAAMLRRHYPRLMQGDKPALLRAKAFAERVHELSAFLVEVRGVRSVSGTFAGRVAYHDGCSGLRELGVRKQPRQLLSSMEGLQLVELRAPETCCGFGGLFSVKFPDISNAMVTAKSDSVRAADVDILAAGEMGCLLNVAGKLSRQGSDVACRHYAELLAGALDEPAIIPQRRDTR